MGDCADVCVPQLLEGGDSKRAATNTRDRTSVFALTNGGTAGMIWGYLIVWAGYMLVFASIAEMASMYVHELASSIRSRPADKSRQGSNLGRSISLGVGKCTCQLAEIS